MPSRLQQQTFKQIWQTLFALASLGGIAYVVYKIWPPPITLTEGWWMLGAALVGISGYLAIGYQVPDKPDAQFRFRAERANRPQNRRNLLKNVRHTWIDGVLNNAVHRDVFITLGLEYERDTGERPWDLTAVPEDEMVADNASIADLFVENGRSLLILGAPASGKTTTLLQLCAHLLDEAEQDANAPLPVVLNLASWADREESLDAWMVDELLIQYQVPREVGQEWLRNRQLTLLLDGLDEIGMLHRRKECITAINQLVADESTDLVVCSRADDYEMLSTELNLSTAVHIQPLTDQQIGRYLEQMGPRTNDLQSRLNDDNETAGLRTLARSPLMLSLMPIAYGDTPPDDIPHMETVDEQRHHLLTQYVDRVFQHRPLPAKLPFDQSQALDWLVNLAHGMHTHKQSIFYIERLQPTWLPSKWRTLYEWLTFVGGMTVLGMCFGPTIPIGESEGLLGTLLFRMIFGLVNAFLFSWLLGLIYQLTYGLPITSWRLPDILHVTRPPTGSFLRSFWRGIWCGLLSGLIAGLNYLYGLDIVGTMFVGLGGGLVVGGILELVDGLDNERGNGLIVGTIFGPAVGLVIGVIRVLEERPLADSINQAVTFGLIAGLILGLFVLPFYNMFDWETVGRRLKPNELLHRTRHHTVLLCQLGLILGIVCAAGVRMMNGQIFDVESAYLKLGEEWPTILLIGFLLMVCGVLYTLLFSHLRIVPAHYSLRVVLAWANILPYPLRDQKLVQFLDSMKDAMLLRRVGGGWVFIHRYLLEFFAAQHPRHDASADKRS